MQSQLVSMESINATHSSYIKTGIGGMPPNITKPWIHKTTARRDTGANINAISQCCAHSLYKQYIQTDRRAFRVRTRGGYITSQQFILLTIKSDAVHLHYNKFYIIPVLPFDYLITRPLLTKLGYERTKINSTLPDSYHHQRESLDSVADEDMVDYPWPVKPM